MPCLAQSVSGVCDRQRRRMSCVSVQAPAGGDQVLTLETGIVARLADGAVMATYVCFSPVSGTKCDVWRVYTWALFLAGKGMRRCLRQRCHRQRLVRATRFCR